MFLCDKCLTEHFKNEPHIYKSVGPCEFCKEEAPCNDIPSRYLVDKDDPKEEHEHQVRP